MSDDLLRNPNHNGHLLVGALKRHKNKTVLFLGDTTVTGGQMAERISQYIQAFEALGAGTGVAVGLLSLNRPEVLLIMGAGQTRGYRRTALHPLGSLDDHAYVLSDAGISSLIIDPNPMFVERALGLLERVDSLKQILTIGPVPEALQKADAHVVDLSAEAAKYQPQPLVPADLPPDQVIGLTYTGGTTGKPKGVMGTAQSISSMTSIQLSEWEWPEEPRFLMITPLSHAGAAYFLPTLIKGGEMHVLPKFDPADVLKTIEEKAITATFLVPSMLYALMDHPDSHTRDLSSLETVYYGASAINPVRLAEAIRRFGKIFAQNYGQSEAPMAITYLAKRDHDEKRLTSCGRPTLFARVALLGEDGKPVTQGEPGEICVSGPLLAGGYWNLPEATARTLGSDGWLRTGDAGYLDGDGYLYIHDRIKDMIISGGENIYPAEVESAICDHPDVAEAAVIGIPDDKWGEAVKAVVVMKPGKQATSSDIINFTRERIAGFKTPKTVDFMEALPRNPSGKILRRNLRDPYWAGKDRQVN